MNTKTRSSGQVIPVADFAASQQPAVNRRQVLHLPLSFRLGLDMAESDLRRQIGLRQRVRQHLGLGLEDVAIPVLVTINLHCRTTRSSIRLPRSTNWPQSSASPRFCFSTRAQKPGAAQVTRSSQQRHNAFVLLLYPAGDRQALLACADNFRLLWRYRQSIGRLHRRERNYRWSKARVRNASDVKTCCHWPLLCRPQALGRRSRLRSGFGDYRACD